MVETGFLKALGSIYSSIGRLSYFNWPIHEPKEIAHTLFFTWI